METDGAQAPSDRSADDALAEVTFPQVARMELDELLDQLVRRARDVQLSEDRLRGLLRAYLDIARTGDPDEVLRQIVSAARRLVGAQYAALGVIRDGHLVQFVHEGMAPATVAAIGHLPQGKGVLGRLVDVPQPLRLANIADHEAFAGFPAGHPDMTCFLGVPIRIADRVFGNLYLTDKQDGAEFSHDDEELVLALATAAAVSIENAAMLDESRRRQQWQAATVDVSLTLLSQNDPETVLTDLVARVRRLCDADGASIAVQADEPGALLVSYADGTYTSWQGQMLSTAGTVAGLALAEGRLILVEDASTDPRTATTAERAPEVGATIAIPMSGEKGTIGVLLVARHASRGQFDRIDLEMVEGLAAQAALGIELAQTRRDSELLRMLEDRQHIAEDLHHRVVQRLFGLGLALQATAGRSTQGEVRSAVNAAVDETDAVIKELRSAIFSLALIGQPPEPDAGPSQHEAG